MEVYLRPIRRTREKRLKLYTKFERDRQELYARRKSIETIFGGILAIGAGVACAAPLLQTVVGRYLARAEQVYDEPVPPSEGITEEGDNGRSSAVAEQQVEQQVQDSQVRIYRSITLPENDRNLLEKVVFLEMTPFDEKDANPSGEYDNAYCLAVRNILSVMDNRVNHELYPKSWRKVLVQEGQFSAYAVYPKFCEKNSPISLEEALEMRGVPKDEWEDKERQRIQELELKLIRIEIDNFLKGLTENTLPKNATIYFNIRKVEKDIEENPESWSKGVRTSLSFYHIKICAEDPEILGEGKRHVYFEMVIPQRKEQITL